MIECPKCKSTDLKKIEKLNHFLHENLFCEKCHLAFPPDKSKVYQVFGVLTFSTSEPQAQE